MSDWVDWGPCSTTCGWGRRTRTRTIYKDARDAEGESGFDCPRTSEDGHCHEDTCFDAIDDCEMEKWLDWTACSKTCGIGVKTRDRKIKYSRDEYGFDCPMKHEKLHCNIDSCPPTPSPTPSPTIPRLNDCQMNPWSDWSSCSATCGSGSKTRHRSIREREKFGGFSCDQYPKVSHLHCNQQPCPELAA